MLALVAACSRPAETRPANPAPRLPAVSAAAPQRRPATSAHLAQTPSRIATPHVSTVAQLPPTSAPRAPAVPHNVGPAATPSAAPTAVATTSESDAAPHIYSAAASPSVVHSGDTIVWDVTTSGNVTTVEAHVPGFTIPLARSGPGHFVVSFQIPSMAPWFLHGDYSVDVVASTRAGASTHRAISVDFR